MAERKEAEDDFNPRHRIVGAVILVALAVIFLPMLLSDRPPETASRGLTDTPTPETRIVVATVPPPGAATAKTEPAVTPAVPDEGAEKPATVTRTVPVEPVVEMPAPASEKPVAKPATEPRLAKTTSTANKSVAPDKGWVVQVGVFSHPDNARRLQDRLKQKGYAALLHPASAEKGKPVRVEVGPFKDAAAAKAAQARIQSELGIKGVVRTQ